MEESRNIELQFEEIRTIIEYHQNNAFREVNKEIIYSSWEVGHYIASKIEEEGWGRKTVSLLEESE